MYPDRNFFRRSNFDLLQNSHRVGQANFATPYNYIPCLIWGRGSKLVDARPLADIQEKDDEE
jgi:hypothetical protein